MIECADCEGDRDEFRRSVYTSSRLQGCSRGYVALDMNVRMALLANKFGLGYAAHSFLASQLISET